MEVKKEAYEGHICIRKVTGDCNTKAVWRITIGAVSITACDSPVCINAAINAAEADNHIYQRELDGGAS